MRIGFIGSGNVAMAFGLYLRGKNQSISGYYSRRFHSAQKAAMQVSSYAFSDLNQLLSASDWIGITTTDDQIEVVATQLAAHLKSANTSIENPMTFFHMSGAKTSESLYPLRQLGHHCFSLHPLQTIGEPLLGSELLKSCTFTLEGDSNEEIESFVKRLGNHHVRIQAKDKAAYHAAACIASNYLYTLVDAAVKTMVLSGFKEDEAFRALRPLMEGTLESCGLSGPAKGLTGPIARGDVGTVKNHLEVFEGHLDLEGVYRTMGLATLQLASSDKLKDPLKQEALKQLLMQETKVF